MTFRVRIIQKDGIWRLAYHGGLFGRFSTQHHAMAAAVRLAKMVEERGGQSVILLSGNRMRSYATANEIKVCVTPAPASSPADRDASSVD